MTNRPKPATILTGRHLRELSRNDSDSPSLKTFLIIEACEWCLYLGLLCIVGFFVKSLFETALRYVEALFG